MYEDTLSYQKDHKTDLLALTIYLLTNIKIIYLLYCISKKEKIDFYDLKTYGFTPHMLETLQVLIDNGNMENDIQKENKLENTLAMHAKGEDIL